MSFQLECAVPVAAAIINIVREQLESAAEHVRTQNLPDESVHEIRKHLKRIRAVLRLVRDELGDDLYRRENGAFRDAGRPLTEIRDARVLLDTFDLLRKDAGNRAKATAMQPVRKALEKHRRLVRKRVLVEHEAASKVRGILDDARQRLDDWPLKGDGWPMLSPGLRAVYKKGCRALAAAAADAAPDTWHEWRKQSKYLWHQVQVIEPLWPDLLKKLADEIHRLSQLLGDDHDLAVLRQVVTADVDAFGGEKAVHALVHSIEGRGEELRQEAVALGSRIYSESPERFAKRLRRYWKAWRTGTPAAAADS